jgi:two-component system, cell cycle response regulator
MAPPQSRDPNNRRMQPPPPQPRESQATPSAADYERLQARYRELMEHVARNELLLRKTQALELELLRAANLGNLLERIVLGLRESYALDVVVLNLLDPQHELRHLSSGEGFSKPVMQNVRFLESIARHAPQLERADRPWLGAYRGSEHRALVPDLHSGSVALIPLPRENRAVGILSFGSRDPKRFSRELASDFLAHLGVVVSISLETALNRARLLRSGVTDYLTGLHNRRYLQDRLREELVRAERAAGELACLMIDVDHFKQINDKYGHLAGDAVLKEIGQRIDHAVRGSDTGARFGGDEFAVLLAGASLADARRLAERIHQAMAAGPVAVAGGARVGLTLSIGVAVAHPARGTRDHAALADQLVAAADAALYRAKHAGRNRIEVAPDVLT